MKQPSSSISIQLWFTLIASALLTIILLVVGTMISVLPPRGGPGLPPQPPAAQQSGQPPGSIPPYPPPIPVRSLLIAGGVIALITATGVGWLLARLALRPINSITQTAQAIGAKRDFSRRIEHPGLNDEVGQLVTTFNGMLAELQAAYLQVEQSLEGQRRFVADASHELRTPLTTIRGNLALLQRVPPISEEDRSDVLLDMVDETERLTRLVNNLLTLARIDAERSLRQEPVQIRLLVESVYHEMLLQEPVQTLTCYAHLEAIVMGDPDALKQVLLVLCDNAIKHTPSDTTITLTARVEEQHVIIAVHDNGPGIKPSKLPLLFDRFYRGDPSRSGTGSGLGLSIAKELTEAHQGTIGVKSQVGVGSTFKVTLKAYKEGVRG